MDQYLETAIWSSMDEQGRSLDRNFDIEDFSQEAVEDAIRVSNDFIKENRKDLEAVGEPGQHGHDFWLTRNRHGAGFWDRGYGEIGKRLTEAAHPYGSANVYVGDDGKLYFE